MYDLGHGVLLSIEELQSLVADIEQHIADAYDEGYNSGYAAGSDEAYNEGIGDGYDEGYDDGFVDAASEAAFNSPPRPGRAEGEMF